ncbi:hypothetical protein CI102_432, partial [Trichoderma harzianum]
GPVVHLLEGHSDYVRCCAFSGDGQHLVSGSDDGSICTWNTATGKMQHKISAFNHYVYLIALSSKGLLAASDGRNLKIWNTNTNTLVEIPDGINLLGTSRQVDDLAFSPDGSLLAVASSGTITIWNLAEYSKVALQWTPASSIHKVAFSPDSKYIAAEAREIYIWDCKSATTMAILSGHTDEICGLSFSHDGLFLASSSRDRTARIWTGPWEGHDKKPLLTLTEHSGAVFGLSFSPSQKLLATCSGDKTLRIWDYETETKPDAGAEEEDQHTSVHKRPICMVSTSHDGDTIASGSEDGLICLWEGKTGILRREIRGHEDFIRCINFSQDSKALVSTSDDETVRVWDAYDENRSLTLRGHESWVRCAIFSPDGQFVVSCSDDRTLRVWDLTATIKDEDEEEVVSSQVLQGHDDYVMCATFSPDGKYLVSGANNGQILLWDFSKAHQKLPLTYKVQIQPTSWSPFGFSSGWFDESDDPEERWITWMGKKLILLPKIHRPTWTTAHGHTVIIGCQSGRLLYFKFKEDADFRDHFGSQ